MHELVDPIDGGYFRVPHGSVSYLIPVVYPGGDIFYAGLEHHTHWDCHAILTGVNKAFLFNWNLSLSTCTDHCLIVVSHSPLPRRTSA